MESPDNTFLELVDIVKSWIPKRSESAYLSRNFWMPDNSCQVCYECDSQFTIFNRRHHCRQCGRVFCAKCTSNSITISSDDSKHQKGEGEKLRVCNYCFKQWRQDLISSDNGIRLSTPALSPSPSTASLASSKSSGVVPSSNTISLMPCSSRPYQTIPYSICLSPNQSACVDLIPDKKGSIASGENLNSVADMGDSSANQFTFCSNRSDDEDDDYDMYRSHTDSRHFHQSVGYYGPDEFGDIGHGYKLEKVHPAEENIDSRDLCFSRDVSAEFHSRDRREIPREETRGNPNDYGDATSSNGIEADSDDFENSWVMWLPPDPEDEEDDREAILFDDDDDEDDPTGEWGSFHSSSSFGKNECRTRDKSSEEHKKAMKNAVDGHFRALVAQLLQVENLSTEEDDENGSWLDIITALSWEAATILKPDTSKGGGMDPNIYVKIKCLACGHRRESKIVRGVVCKKNVAHRRMTSKIDKPRFMILGGALEYQRVSNHLSSFDTLLQQEMDHLKMAVAKIDVHHPNVLLVEKSVSRFAQEYLLEKDISLVLNIKRPVLERIARCTGAHFIPSIDHLSSQKLGHCETFHVEKFVEAHGSAGQYGKQQIKTLMFFEGCPKPLGCTVLLRGASGDELKKVKHVVQYGVFAAYHLALETSFLVDEGASLPELPLKTPITVALPDKPSSIDRSISTIPGFTIPDASSKTRHSSNYSDLQRSNGSFMSYTMEPNIKASIETNESSMPPSPYYFGPYMSGTIPNSVHIDRDITVPQNSSGVQKATFFTSKYLSEAKLDQAVGFSSHQQALKGIAQTGFDPIYGDDVIPRYVIKMSNGNAISDGVVHTDLCGEQIVGTQHVSPDLGCFHLDNNNCNEQASKEDFPPSTSDHQSILVSLSTRCVWKGTVCERAHLFRIKYYGNFDRPLGRFLRDHLFNQDYSCRSCKMPAEAHVHCYTHRQGSLTIAVRKLKELPLPGEREGKIWMWHRCLKCPRPNKYPPATQRIVMSDVAWGLSFGKFLELSFSNHAAASRVASCGHSLHRDCLRFFGFGHMVACFRYASIDVHSVHLPPSKLEFNCQHQQWINIEANEVVDKAKLLFTEVLNALYMLNSRIKVSESRRHIVALEKLLQKEKADFEESFQKALNEVKGQSTIDVLEINQVRRQLMVYSYLWDKRLRFAANLDCSPENPSNSLTKLENDKLAEFSLGFKQGQSFTNCDSLLDHKMESLRMVSASIDSEVESGDEYLTTSSVNNTEKVVNVHSPNADNTVDRPDPSKAGSIVGRVLSEDQFPIIENLSDTLDAAWTGENCSDIIQLDGIAKLLDNISVVESVAAESAVSISESDYAEDKTQTLTNNVPERTTEDDDSSWIGMSFLNFYHAFNKNFWGTPRRFESLADYKPVYVSSYREMEHQGGVRLLLPIGLHDIVVPIYDDEPTSIISYSLVSPEYQSQMSEESDRLRDGSDPPVPLLSYDSGSSLPLQSSEDVCNESLRSFGSFDENLLSTPGNRNSVIPDPLLYTKAMHVRVSFIDDGPLGKMKYTVICYYAKRFEALRKICCPSETDFVRSLSRCKKWGPQGGKSNVFFAKTLDDRFIIKQVTKTELDSFIKFAPEYFKYLSASIDTGSPTCLAKILGMYQVTSKQLKGGKETKIDVLVMENLLFGRNLTRLYDLKGSSRSRYNADSSGSNKVLLDQNLIEAMPTSPIFVGNKAKRLLERAVWNDTSFLASIDVMDYSLLVGVDEERHELVLGIIDFMRQYTWDKHLETWVKASGILGGPKNESPTVISPKQYKKRFRKAMSAYFLMVPDQWSPPTIIPTSASQSDFGEDNSQCSSLE